MKFMIELNIHEAKQVLETGSLLAMVEDIKALNELAQTIKPSDMPADTLTKAAEKAKPASEDEKQAPQVIFQQPEEESKISEVEIRAKFVELSKKGKKKELKALLEEFGVEKVSDLQPDQYAAAWARLEAL